MTCETVFGAREQEHGGSGVGAGPSGGLEQGCQDTAGGGGRRG